MDNEDRHGPVFDTATCLVKSMVTIGSLTSKSAVALSPFPPCVDEMTLVSFAFVPAVVPVTVTENSHDPAAARDPPVTAMVLVEAVRVRLFVPPQTDWVPSVIVTPVGRTSVKLNPDNDEPEFGFVIVNVNVDVAFFRMAAGENDLARRGGSTTVMDAVA